MPWVWEEPLPLTELGDGTVVCYIDQRHYWFQFEDSDEGWPEISRTEQSNGL